MLQNRRSNLNPIQAASLADQGTLEDFIRAVVHAFGFGSQERFAKRTDNPVKQRFFHSVKTPSIRFQMPLIIRFPFRNVS